MRGLKNAPVCPIHCCKMRELLVPNCRAARGHTQAEFALRRQIASRRAFRCPVIGCVRVATVPIAEPLPEAKPQRRPNRKLHGCAEFSALLWLTTVPKERPRKSSKVSRARK